MKAVNMTLIFNGQTEAAFNFYKSVFGGEFTHLQRLKDIPNAPEMSTEETEKILHMGLPVANILLSGMDMPSWREAVKVGDNFMIVIDTNSEEETETLFDDLSAGGQVMMPPGHQFWGAFFAMFTDKFGIQWQVSYVK
jgi:PhnB protein